jgi:[protein-PII] uridylyltransferase
VQPLCDDFFAEIEPGPLIRPTQVNQCVRAYLSAVDDYLLDLHDAGVQSRRVNEEHSDLIDRLVRKLFRISEDRYFDNFPRLGSYRLAVVAVGGYGRRELSLGSDLDMLFLYRGKLNPYVETLTESISHRLWDARLTLAAATRTLADCRRIGHEDLSTLTSFLDARFLIGDPGLFSELELEVEKWIRADPGKFISDKLVERAERHVRFGESPFLLQPNVRESVGGLRDYHTALWIARAANWEVRRPEHLMLHGFIDATQQDELFEALEFQWRVRNELHRNGRKEDRLHFAAMEPVAARFGYKGDERVLAVEELMRAYYLHARTVQSASQQAIGHARRLEARRTRAKPPEKRPVEEGFAIADERLEIPSTSLLEERPARLISAFAVAQRHGVDFSSRARSVVRDHLYLIDDGFRNDPEVAEIFLGILSSPNRVYRALEQMNDLGVLGAYLPEFGWIVGLWQHDLYHTYTVDAHSLFLVEQLRRLTKGTYAEELPLPTELIPKVANPPELLLGALLHDIGKGRGGGHSRKGADLVPEIAKRLGLDAEQTDEVQFLVQHHLTLSAFAERRDVHDSRLILNVAKLVGTRRRLRNLYLLTVADIRSVSPEAWTPWKAGLLEALYRNVSEWMEAGLEEASASGFFIDRAMERAQRTQDETLRRARELGISEKQAIAFLETMPPRYLLAHDSAEISQHLVALMEHLAGDLPAGVHAVQPERPAAGFQGLVVLAPDRPGLLAMMCGILRAAGRNILGAQVYTTRDSLAVEIFELEPLPGGVDEEEADRLRFERRLNAVLAGHQDIEAIAASIPPHQPYAFRRLPTEVHVSNDDSEFYTIVDISATDRPGILFDITRVLAESRLDVVMSRVTTRATRVTDAFYVTDEGHKLLDETRIREVEETVLRAIRQGRV